MHGERFYASWTSYSLKRDFVDYAYKRQYIRWLKLAFLCSSVVRPFCLHFKVELMIGSLCTSHGTPLIAKTLSAQFLTKTRPQVSA